MARSTAVEAAEARTVSFGFACTTPEGKALWPKFGDIDGVFYTDLPAQREHHAQDVHVVGKIVWVLRKAYGRVAPTPEPLAAHALNAIPIYLVDMSSVLSIVKCRIEAFELHACIVGVELPVDLGLDAVAGVLPSGDFPA